MKLSHIFILAPVLCLSAFADAQTTVTNQDGREIILNDDGTWEYAPEGIIVETEDGRKAQLKPDNTWQYLGNTELQEDVIQGGKSASAGRTKINLNAVFITTTGPKSTNIVKNTRTSSAMHFVVDVTLDKSQSSINVANLKSGVFNISDSKNKTYTIDTITGSPRLIPGETTSLQITTTSAPGGLFSPDEVYLNVAQGTLGLGKPFAFSTRVRDIDVRR